LNASVKCDFTLLLPDEIGQTLADLYVIDNSGFGDMDGLETRRVWFEFFQSFSRDDFTANTICLTALVNSLQAGNFVSGDGDDYLATVFKGDLFTATKILHGGLAIAAILSFE